FLFRLYFFLLPPHLRTPSLFPYTTLFRSAFGDAGRDLDARSLRDLRAVHPAARAARAARRRPGRRRPRRISASRPRPLPARPPRDRKSTRLNSSHVKISYAVFCLKKKKK